jgi:DNA-3-methyladenine glycosylase I
MRCAWVKSHDQLECDYHDQEWGVPVHDDVKLFEFLILDAFQAGLTWNMILHKREGFRKAFANFDVEKVAAFTESDLEPLYEDTSIIRNKLKIKAAVTNAQAFIKVQAEFGSFDQYIWQFTEGRTKVNAWTHRSQVPATSPESDAMSKDLKKRGFKFVGTTICYAFMQAAGMINDHTTDCFCYTNQ